MTSQSTGLFTAIKNALSTSFNEVEMFAALTQALRAGGIPENRGEPYVSFTYRPYTPRDMMLFGDNKTHLYIDGRGSTYKVYLKRLLPGSDEISVDINVGAETIYIFKCRLGDTVITTGDKLVTPEQRFSLLKTIRKMREVMKEGDETQACTVHFLNKVNVKVSSVLNANTGDLEASAREIFVALEEKRRDTCTRSEEMEAFINELYCAKRRD